MKLIDLSGWKLIALIFMEAKPPALVAVQAFTVTWAYVSV